MGKREKKNIGRKKAARSHRNKTKGKYLRQRERSEANKARRIARHERMVRRDRRRSDGDAGDVGGSGDGAAARGE